MKETRYQQPVLDEEGLEVSEVFPTNTDDGRGEAAGLRALVSERESHTVKIKTELGGKVEEGDNTLKAVRVDCAARVENAVDIANTCSICFDAPRTVVYVSDPPPFHRPSPEAHPSKPN